MAEALGTPCRVCRKPIPSLGFSTDHIGVSLLLSWVLLKKENCLLGYWRWRMPTERSLSQTSIESADTSSIRQQMLHAFQTGKEYRHSFVEEAIRSRLTAQIKNIREHRQWDYKKFAEEIGKKISWAYRLEDPNSAHPTIPTLLQVAEAFDVALDVRFSSFSELLDDVTTLNPKSFQVASFGEEMGLGAFSRVKRTRKIRGGGRRRKAVDVSHTSSGNYIGSIASRRFAIAS